MVARMVRVRVRVREVVQEATVLKDQILEMATMEIRTDPAREAMLEQALKVMVHTVVMVVGTKVLTARVLEITMV